MKVTAQERAKQLLDAQTAFWLKNLSKKQLVPLLKEEVMFLHRELGKLKLKQTISREKVKATAQRYAVDMEIGGAIPELFGEIADVIYNFPSNQHTLVGDLVSDEIAHEFIEKVFEDGSVFDHAVANIHSSEPFKAFLSDVVYTVLKGYALEQNQLLKIGTVASSMKFVRGLISDRAPKVSELIEARIRELMGSGVDGSLSMVDEVLTKDQYREGAKDAVLDLWDKIKEWPVSNFQHYVTALDLQELLVLGYEFWLQLRSTPYLQDCISAGVDFFFDKYGDETLETLLNDLGVTQDMIVSDVLNYVPDMTSILVKKGIAEQLIRRHLQRFYEDPDTLALLA